MNRRLTFFGMLFLFLIFTVSCSPIEETTIPKEDVTIAADAEEIDMTASNDRRGISLSFKPVSGARTYAISLDGSEEKIRLSPILEDGTYKAYEELPDGSIGQSSSVSLRFFASSSLSPDAWTELFTISAPYVRPEISTIAPKAEVTERNETEAVITIIDAPEPDMQYRITIEGKDITSSASAISISGLDPAKSYSATIYHKYREDADYGPLTAEVMIGQYAAITVDIDEATRDIEVAGIPEGFTSIRLVKAGEPDITIKEKSVSGETHTFPASIFPSFDIGTFQIFAEDGNGNAAQSEEFAYYSSVPEISRTTTGRQHHMVSFQVSSDVAGLSGSSSIGDGVDITISGNTATAVISGLESLTEYDAPTITVTSGLASVDIPLDTVTTGSFEGMYRWTAPEGDEKRTFTIRVDKATESPRYKYYIYAIDGDKEYQICPLIDKPLDELKGITVNFKNPEEAYVTANAAYKWNYEHWVDGLGALIGSSAINSWKINNVENDDDFVKTIVDTEATMGISTKTMTSFDMTEDKDLNVRIIFRNEGTGMAASSMYTNPNWQSDGLSDKWSFGLISFNGKTI